MLKVDTYENEIDYPTNKRGTAVAARSVKDPIHDMIPISSRLSTFIDTKQFQRLRNIKQLGTSYYVWLGASHNRFEHCMGVAYLARSLAFHLKMKQPELMISERDIECVEIAGLCHDLGHGPWSHVWDAMFIPKALPDRKWKHEDASVMMFDVLVKENGIVIDPKDVVFVKALISGDAGSCPDEKPFLFDIVANKRNGLDVDKFDYIPRDSHMIGDKMNIALMRIINSARVLDNQICYDIKDVNLIYEICATRFKLHKMVYNHKAAKAIEYMVVDALLSAEPYLHIAEQVFDPDRYIYLTDDIMPRIEASTEPELAPARAIFDRIRNRELYRMVDYKVVDWPRASVFEQYITPQRIVDAAKALSPRESEVTDLASTLRAEDIVCDFSLMHYGMMEKNPLDFVRFYSKRHPNRPAKAERGVYSNLMPEYHAELLVRVFTKNDDYFGIVQAGYRACVDFIHDQVRSGDEDLTLEPLFPLPPEPSRAPSSTPSVLDSQSPKSRVISRAPSFTTSGALADTALFSNNSFTTVAPDFVPGSPSRKFRRTRSLRDSSMEDEVDGFDSGPLPSKKSRK